LIRNKTIMDDFHYIPSPSSSPSMQHRNADDEIMKPILQQQPSNRLFTSRVIYENTGQIRYFQLGLITLQDALNNKQLKKGSFISIYDNLLQEVLCFKVQDLYENYIKEGNDMVKTHSGEFKLSDETKSLVMNEINETYERLGS